MTYNEWSKDEVARRNTVITKLKAQEFSTSEIVEYFNFENMVKNEPNYCPLYATSTKCHDREKLNCFFCGCPYFTYSDKGISQRSQKTVYSKCELNAIKSSEFTTETAIHLDCSNCEIPHRLPFVHANAGKIIKECKDA